MELCYFELLHLRRAK